MNVTFKNNTAHHGGGIYAAGFANATGSVEATNFTMLNFIENNSSNSGGAVHFENLQNFSLFNSIFQKNIGQSKNNSLFEANSKGGALYYSCEGDICQADLHNCTFANNSADIGGAIYYNAHLFLPNSSLFMYNSATSQGEYGPTFGSYPIQLLYSKDMNFDTFTHLGIVFEDGTKVSRTEYIQKFFIDPNNFTEYEPMSIKNISKTALELELYNQTGGQPFIQNITLYAIDHFGQQITVDSQEFYIKFYQTDGPSTELYKGESTKKEIKSTRGAFTLTGGFVNDPGTSLNLKMETNIFEDYDYDIALYGNTTFSIRIGFRKCSIGEILPINTNICSLCPPNTFSLDEPVNSTITCTSCNKMTGATCKKGGSMLAVDPGYWRLNKLSMNIKSCSNQKACMPATPDTSSCSTIYPNLIPSQIQSTCINFPVSIETAFSSCSIETRNAIRTYCDQIQNGTLTGVCNQGYNGTLCGECQQGWGTSTAYKCVLCDITAWFFIQLFAFSLLRLALIGYTVYQAHEGKRNKDQSSTLRILINFFQVINILLVIPFQWPTFVETFKASFISLFSSGTTTVGGFSYECIADWMGLKSSGLTYFEMNAVYAFISPIYWTIIIGALVALRYKIARRSIISSDFKESLIITFIVTYFYIWPDLMAVAFNLFNCVDVGSQSRSKIVLQLAPQLECYTARHWVLLAVSGFPTIILWGIIIPLKCFLTIRRNKSMDMLGDEHFAKRYGFIYQGYTRRFYWWEFLILARKVVLLIISVFLLQNLTVMCLTIFLEIVLFTILQLRGAPYTNTALNSLELTSLISIGAILYTCLYHLSLKNEGSTLSFVGIASISTVLFFIQWIGYYFIYLRENIAYCWSLLKGCRNKIAGYFGYKPDTSSVESQVPIDEEDEDAMSDRHYLQEYNKLSPPEFNSLPVHTNSPLAEPILQNVASSHSPKVVHWEMRGYSPLSLSH